MRLFGVLVVSLFVLTLLFAVAAGAQKESAAEETTVLAADAADRKVEAETDNVSVKVDNGEVSVSTDDGSSSDDGTAQQSSLTVQQNQTVEGSGSRASTGDVNIDQRTTTQATTDLNGERAKIEDTDSDNEVDRVEISGLRSCEESGGTVSVNVREQKADGKTIAYFTDEENDTDIDVDSGKVVITPDNRRNLTVPSGFDPGTGEVTSSSGIRCGNDNNNNGGGGHNSANNSVSTSQTDGTETTTDTTATDTTATDTTTSAEAQTAEDQSLQESSNTGNVDRSGDNFRCVDILRVARNPGRGQYVSSQRFEECLSGDILADTIPNRRLPGTGGPPLALLAACVLLVSGLAAGASVFRAGTRRRR